jgi:hypothetical protein
MSPIIIVAILLSIASPATAAGTDLFDLQANFTDNPEIFASAVYLGVYTFCWAFLIEISLIIILHFKQNEFYVSEHAAINLMIVIGQSCNTLFLLRRTNWDFANGFIVREIILSGIVLLQIIVGSQLNRKLMSLKLVRGIFILRYVHRMLGVTIYFFAKAQIAIYALYFWNQSSMGYGFVGLAFGLVLITHAVAAFVLRAYDAASTDSKVEFLIRNSPNKAEYSEILRNVENGDLDDITENLSINEAFNHDDTQSLHTTLTAKKNIDWVLIEDRLYDITGLRHPKGNYILRAARFHDITREMHGLKSWRFENRDTRYTKTSKHQHVNRTFRFLNTHCIGEIALPGVLMFKNEKRVSGSVSETTSNLEFMGDNTGEVHLRREKRITDWKLGPVFNFSGTNSSGKMLFFEKIAEDVVLNLSSYWNMNYGRYFLVKLADGQCFSSFVILAAVPKYMQARDRWYKQLEIPFLASLASKKSRDCQELMEMGSILEGAKSKLANDALKTDADIKDYFLPLFVWKEKRAKPQSMKKVRINGPLGFGCGFNHKSTQNILVLAKDEGILPFTDLLEFLSQRSLIEMTGSKIPHPIFGREYLLDFANGMTLYLYWEVSQEFRDYAALLGLSSLEVVEGVAQEAVDRPEEMRPRLLNVFKGATVVSNLKKETGRFLTFQYESGMDYPSYKKIALRGQEVNIERLVVSGPQSFVSGALRHSDIPFQHTVIL